MEHDRIKEIMRKCIRNVLILLELSHDESRKKTVHAILRRPFLSKTLLNVTFDLFVCEAFS